MIIVYNGRMITRDEKNPFIEDGAVLIDGKIIKEVGKTTQLKKKYPKSELIDAKGGLIMPAFINMHEHIYSAMARGLSIKGYKGNTFLEILDGQWWKIDRNLNNNLTYYSALETYIECIKNGVTTIFDHHASFGEITNSLDFIEKANNELGLRSCLCYETSDRDGQKKSDSAIKENIRFIKKCEKDKSDMIKAMFGMHAQFTLSDKTLEKSMKDIPKGVGVHIHVAEGIEDLHACLKDHHKRIVDRLYDFGILGEKTMLAHAIYVNEHELDLIKHSNTMVVHNPESNMGNACGCPPTLRQFQKGILVGLGSDGYTHDMMESYKVAKLLHQHSNCDATCAWGEIPAMLFENNAKMANRYFKTPLGKIKKGYSGDVIVVNYIPPTPMNKDNISGHLLFGINGAMVNTTICAGKVLMKDRKLQNIDEEKTLAKIREASKVLWKKING
ncbi:MAG: putative aminohydrolase SsnA [Eubacteriales bacterium]|nr:putative aminohydrolase SsnA [Eubacteriales bacterium]